MKLILLAIGQRPPTWVTAGFETYATRLPDSCRLELVEIPAPKRGKKNAAIRNVELEGERLLAAIPSGSFVVALDESGKSWTTRDLTSQLTRWQQDGRDICLMIGGADGLSNACLERADVPWSLSPMTFPHALVRIIVAEQIYRAWSLLQGHPYHRD